MLLLCTWILGMLVLYQGISIQSKVDDDIPAEITARLIVLTVIIWPIYLAWSLIKLILPEK